MNTARYPLGTSCAVKGKRTVVITGATSGIGRAAATALAQRGFRVIVVARNASLAGELLQQLELMNPGAGHDAIVADLSQLTEVRQAALTITSRAPRIDVLANNVGAVFHQRTLTPDGLERTFALNHLSHFLLTLLLIGPLRQAGRSRIICTSSSAHRRMRLDPDDLQMAHDFRGYALLQQNAYGRSKLCNLLFTRELARRLRGTGMQVAAFHPGVTESRFGVGTQGAYAWVLALARHTVGVTAEQGAKTLVQFAAAEIESGDEALYFERGRPAKPSDEALDDRAAALLWQASVRLTGIDLSP